MSLRHERETFPDFNQSKVLIEQSENEEKSRAKQIFHGLVTYLFPVIFVILSPLLQAFGIVALFNNSGIGSLLLFLISYFILYFSILLYVLYIFEAIDLPLHKDE